MDHASSNLEHVAWVVALYGFGLFNWILYLGLAIYSGSFFKKQTEQDRLQLAIARDSYWNLSKSPIPQFSHRFYKLRSGLKLHYVTNTRQPCPEEEALRNLVIFIHGFPDSCILWRHLLQKASSKNLTEKANVVCVDLPGYGGSDSFERYGADEVLEALTEFIIAMRALYGFEDEETGRDLSKTFIVGHDWGCVLAFRLAAEAPCLANRFILTNGPHVELCLANKDRILSSAAKIFKQFRQSPRTHSACLSKSFHAIKPLIIQVLLFGYIFAFQLPAFMVRYLGTGGNFAFLRGAHGIAYGSNGRKEYNVSESLACTLGPGADECKTQTQTALGEKSETYGPSVLERANNPGKVFMHHTAYYRDGASYQPWSKSLQTTADLFNIENNYPDGSPFRRRSSSGSSTMFGELYKGALRAPATILWGEQDQACSKAICLDGIGDYLARNSEVILLPRSSHWTPIESESRTALARVVELYVSRKNGEADLSLGEVEKAVTQVYPGATAIARK